VSELRKALHELVDKGQIDCFLKKGLRFLQEEREPVRPDPSSQIMVPTMLFDGGEGPRFTSPHNDPLVVEMIVAIITWDCLRKLKYSEREIVPLVHPILGFGGQEVNSTGMIRLPLRFGDKAKARTLEVDFLVVDMPTAYNVILGWLTLHKVKSVIAQYLLQLQFKADDRNVGTMQGDQRTTRECYLISIRSLVERTTERVAADSHRRMEGPRSGHPLQQTRP